MATNYTTLRNNIIETAKKEVGYKEKPSNITKYWADMYPPFQGGAWCAAYNGWVWLIATGVDIRPLLELEYYVPGLRSWAMKIGAWKTSGQKNGDMVIYKNSKGSYFHTGLVWRDENSSLYRAIEGNTSPTNAGSQGNGGGVYIRYRNKSMIAGYIDFEKVVEYYKLTPKGTTNTVPKAPNTSALVKEVWETSPTIKAFTKDKTKDLQTKLVKLGFSVGKSGVDGSYKADTVKAVKEFQKKYKLAIDGVAGPKTLNKINELVKPSKPSTSVSKPSTTKPKSKAPAYPLPKGFVYGNEKGPVTQVSGRTSNSKTKDVVKDSKGKYYSKGLKQWQAQMKKRGWNIEVDGRYGPNTEKVATQFKKNKKLGNDGRIGPVTWAATWDLPVK